MQPAADKASMTCSRLAIYLSTYLSSLPSIHPCINLSFTLDSLSLSRPLVAMRSSLPTIHAIMWCFWPYSAICPSISSCNPQVNYVSIYLARYLPMGLPTPCRLLLLETTALDVAFGCFGGYPLSAYLPNHLPIYRSIDRSIYPIHPTIHPSNYPSIHLSMHPSIRLSIYLSIFLSIYLPIYLSIYLSIYRSIYLSIKSFLSDSIYLILSI